MADSATLFGVDDLLYLMRRLRDPVSGCPWDLKQSYQSIAPSTLEEAYEVVDAIERETSMRNDMSTVFLLLFDRVCMALTLIRSRSNKAVMSRNRPWRSNASIITSTE